MTIGNLGNAPRTSKEREFFDFEYIDESLRKHRTLRPRLLQFPSRDLIALSRLDILTLLGNKLTRAYLFDSSPRCQKFSFMDRDALRDSLSHDRP